MWARVLGYRMVVCGQVRSLISTGAQCAASTCSTRTSSVTDAAADETTGCRKRAATGLSACVLIDMHRSWLGGSAHRQHMCLIACLELQPWQMRAYRSQSHQQSSCQAAALSVEIAQPRLSSVHATVPAQPEAAGRLVLEHVFLSGCVKTHTSYDGACTLWMCVLGATFDLLCTRGHCLVHMHTL